MGGSRGNPHRWNVVVLAGIEGLPASAAQRSKKLTVHGLGVLEFKLSSAPIQKLKPRRFIDGASQSYAADVRYFKRGEFPHRARQPPPICIVGRWKQAGGLQAQEHPCAFLKINGQIAPDFIDIVHSLSGHRGYAGRLCSNVHNLNPLEIKEPIHF